MASIRTLLAILPLAVPLMLYSAETGTAASAPLEFKASARYLNLPVKKGAPKRRVSLSVEGKIAREFEIELAEGTPDFWAFLDLSPFQGHDCSLKAEPAPANPSVLSSIVQSDRILGSENLYRELLRPQFHFSSRRGWNNDPNGLVFFQGEYHLYYQHNPYGWDWGNMHWGHAVSRDLVHWQELPIALYPYRFGDWAFSGSAVVDEKNTSGFKIGKEPALVLAYTSTGRGECIAYSNDRGRTWTEFEGNPVVKHDGRDPRLFWHEPSRQWGMALYNELNKGRWITFYTSPDLKHWKFESRIEGFYECPDIFPLPYGGKTKWVLTTASSEYMVGEFDGSKFLPETPKLPGHRGTSFYAAQTFSNIPKKDGRRIQIGWGTIPTPGMPFNQMMCFPTEMTLKKTAEGPRVAWQPVREIRELQRKRQVMRSVKLNETKPELSVAAGELLDVALELEPGSAKQITLSICGVPVVYTPASRELACLKKKNSVPETGNPRQIRIRALLDRTSLEIFAGDGLLYMPMDARAEAGNNTVSVSVSGGECHIVSMTVYDLASGWGEANDASAPR